MNDRYDQSNAAFQKIRGTFSGSAKRFKKRLKRPAATTATRLRTSIAIGGLVLLLSSVGIASGISTPGQFRSALVAMLPFASTKPDLPPPALAGVIGYGEVVAARELSLSVQAAGRVTQVPVRVGDTVHEGTTIVRIDDAEAKRIVRDAETDVARAELALARVGSEASAPADGASRADAAAALFVALDQAYVKISNMFPSLPEVISGLEGILNGGLFADPMGTNHLTAQADRANVENPEADSVKLRATERYEDAKRKHEVAIARLRSVPGNPDEAILQTVLTEANDAVSSISEATKATHELYVFLKSHLEERGLGAPTVFQKYEIALSEYSSQLDDQAAILVGMIENVHSVRAGISGNDSVATDTAIERQEAQLELQQSENALIDARARLALYDVKAPFDGVIAGLGKNTGQYASEGEDVASLISSDALAYIMVRESDVTKIRRGQRARVSLEGSDMNFEGSVAEIDIKGEKGEDGITRFHVTIALENDDRIKTGMQVVARFWED